MDKFIKKYTKQYAMQEYKVQKKAEYTLFSFILIAIYVLIGVVLMQFGRQMGAMYVASIAIVCVILAVTWFVFVKGHLLISQHILLSAGILAIISHLFMQLNFHFYIQIIFVLVVGYVVHISKLQISIIVSLLVSLMIGRSVFLYYQYMFDANNLILFKQNIFIVASIMMIMVFVHFFNEIISREITETHRLSEIANFDILTGLLCRNKFNDDMGQLDRDESSYSLAIIDIDHFKKINDEYGHDAGDQVLIKLSNLMMDHFKIESVYRWGGEEFVVVSKSPYVDQFVADLEKLRIEVMHCQFLEGERITISIGVSQKKQNQRNIDTFVSADQALFMAKNSGRNQTIIEGVNL